MGQTTPPPSTCPPKLKAQYKESRNSRRGFVLNSAITFFVYSQELCTQFFSYYLLLEPPILNRFEVLLRRRCLFFHGNAYVELNFQVSKVRAGSCILKLSFKKFLTEDFPYSLLFLQYTLLICKLSYACHYG